MINKIKLFLAREISWVFNKRTRCILVYKHWWTNQSYVTVTYFIEGIKTNFVKYDTTLIFGNRKKTRRELHNFAKEEVKKIEDWDECV